MLVVGDPGLGKSQMLRSISGIAPRGVYVCGNTTTTAGLTVTLHKDGSSGDYALEAGALVLGDQVSTRQPLHPPPITNGLAVAGMLLH